MIAISGFKTVSIELALNKIEDDFVEDDETQSQYTAPTNTEMNDELPSIEEEEDY